MKVKANGFDQAFEKVVGRKPSAIELSDARTSPGTQYREGWNDARKDFTLEDGRSVEIFFYGGPNDEYDIYIIR